MILLNNSDCNRLSVKGQATSDRNQAGTLLSFAPAGCGTLIPTLNPNRPTPMKLALNLALALILLTAACSPIYLEYSYPEGVDFAQYKTYAWLPLPKSEGVVTPPSGESQLQKRIRIAIERELDAKCLKKVADDGDLGVRYQVGADFSTDVQI